LGDEVLLLTRVYRIDGVGASVHVPISIPICDKEAVGNRTDGTTLRYLYMTWNGFLHKITQNLCLFRLGFGTCSDAKGTGQKARSGEGPLLAFCGLKQVF
jgi:hypothetical protein